MNNPDNLKQSDEPALTTLPTTWQPRWDSADMTAFTYRSGKTTPTLKRMLDQLPMKTLESSLDEAQIKLPISNLNIAEDGDWSDARVHSWAAANDVLSFYKERVLNEGYWLTAKEHRTIFELARVISYEARPGVAASTYLIFNVLTRKNEPPRQATLPAALQVQNIPASGQLPQMFETADEFIARSDWNALRPTFQRGIDPQMIRVDDPTVQLIGATINLEVGDSFLIVGDPLQPGSKKQWVMGTVTALQPDRQRNCTVITWDMQLISDPRTVVLLHPTFFALRQTASFAGYTQAGVYLSPSRHSSWEPTSIGLPHIPIHAFVSSVSGTRFVGTSEGLYASTDRATSWQPIASKLARKDILTLINTPEGHLYAGTGDGSVYRSRDNGITWRVTDAPESASQSGHSLPKAAIHTLLNIPDAEQPQLAAGTDYGVFVSADRGGTWRAVNDNLPKTKTSTGRMTVITWALAVMQREWRRDLFAATEKGVFRIKSRPGAVRAMLASLLITLMGFVTFVLLGGASNTLSETFDGARSIEATMPPTKAFTAAVQIISPTQLQTAIAGIKLTLARAFETPAGFLALIALVSVIVTLVLNRLDQILVGLPFFSLGKPVHALAVGPGGQLFAGTEHGIYRSNDSEDGTLIQRMGRNLQASLLGDLGRRWTKLSDLADYDVRTLTLDLHGNLLVGTQDGMVFVSDNGKQYEPFPSDSPLKSVEAIHPTTEGIYVVGVPHNGIIEPNWSPTQHTNGQLDLDQVYPDLQPNDWVLLRETKPSNAALFQAESVNVIDSTDSLKPGKITRITLKTASDQSSFSQLPAFDRTSTKILTRCEPFEIYVDTPIWRDEITFDHLVVGLKPGQHVIVMGKRMRARLIIPVLKLSSDDGLLDRTFHLGDWFWVIGIRYSTDQWLIQDQTGFTSLIPISSVSFESAWETDQTVSEVAVIKSIVDDMHQTTVTLQAPLTNLYDRATVTIHGNVVAVRPRPVATGEALGAARMSTGQRFEVKQSPLTYESGPKDTGIATTLKLAVNGIDLAQVPALYDPELGRNAYADGPDTAATASIAFGDSALGSRLSGGTTQQIMTTYHTGLGAVGDLSATGSTLWQTSAPSIKRSVEERLSASAVPMQAGTGVQLRSLRRIVSLNDHETFARMFPGVSKAQIKPFTLNGSPMLYLTIAGARGSEIAVESDLYRKLTDSFSANRALPIPTLTIGSFEPIYFNVQARLRIAADFWEDSDLVLENAQRALLDAFKFDQRELGQPVTPAEVTAVLLAFSAGIAAVEDLKLSMPNQNPMANVTLEAKQARLDNGTPVPAQLLLINPITFEGIRLSIAQAT